MTHHTRWIDRINFDYTLTFLATGQMHCFHLPSVTCPCNSIHLTPFALCMPLHNSLCSVFVLKLTACIVWQAIVTRIDKFALLYNIYRNYYMKLVKRKEKLSSFFLLFVFVFAFGRSRTHQQQQHRKTTAMQRCDIAFKFSIEWIVCIGYTVIYTYLCFNCFFSLATTYTCEAINTISSKIISVSVPHLILKTIFEVGEKFPARRFI